MRPEHGSAAFLFLLNIKGFLAIPSFFSNLRSALSAPVGNRQTSMPNDLIQTRRNFSRLGRYDGDTELSVLDRGLDSTIRTFQRDKGLKQDGIMNPGGETERALNRDLEHMMRPSEERQPYFVFPIRLSASVGNSKANQSEDVKQVQRSLGRLGLASESKLYEPSGILDKETVDSMQLFQKSNDLRVDGFMNPGGETETAMNSSLYRLSAPLSEDGGGDDQEEDPEEPDCASLKEEIEALNGEKIDLEEIIENLKSEAEDLRQEIDDAYQEFLDIAQQYESSRIPTPNSIANKWLDSIYGTIVENTTPDALDEERAWKKYEEIKLRNEKKIEELESQIRESGEQIRKLQKQIEELTAEYRASGCGKSKE